MRLVHSKDECRQIKDDERSQVIGNKASGLVADLGLAVPDLVVIPAQAEALFLELGDRAFGQLLANEPPFRTLMERKTGSLMVRSSGVAETLGDRGRFLSLPSARDVEELARAAGSVWADARRDISAGDMAVIVQDRIPGTAMGHASNERRLSRQSNLWHVEWQGSRGLQTEIVRVDLKEARRRQPVSSVVDMLHALPQGSLFHLEWVFDGHRCWLVQVDDASTPFTEPPGTAFQFDPPVLETQRFKVFLDRADVQREWGKVQAVDLFERAEQQIVPIAVLEQPDVLKELFEGKVPTELLEDLKIMTDQPLVIRTDIIKKDGASAVLAPRTDCCLTVDDAIDFLTSTTQELVASDLDYTEFCFIAHRFIKSDRGAFVSADPHSSLVWIDCTWGVPDSLLFYSHDTFLIDLSGDGGRGRVVDRRIRCKEWVVDVAQDGSWKPRLVGRPWDWTETLSNEGAIAIARSSVAIAQADGRPLEIMFFLNARVGSVTWPHLPWYRQPRGGDLPARPMTAPLSRRRWTVKEDGDIDRLSEELARNPGFDPLLYLLPTEAHLRDSQFLDRIARVALDHDLSVELQGSLLSHAYFVLQRQNIPLVSSAAWNQPDHRQQFLKLVRDKIPEAIRANQELADTEQLDRVTHEALLRRKLIEEGLEVLGATEDELLEELGDVLEVVGAIAKVNGVSMAEVQRAASAKEARLGAFERGTLLLGTHANRATDDRTADPPTRSPGSRSSPYRGEIPLVPPIEPLVQVRVVVNGADLLLTASYSDGWLVLTQGSDSDMDGQLSLISNQSDSEPDD